MLKNIVKFFDKLEDRVRYSLSRRPIVYAFIGGAGIVLFWRGIWHLADDYGMTSWESLIVSVIVLLLTGTFVSFFIGEQILISGLKEEKKTDEKTEEEIEEESHQLRKIVQEIDQIRKVIAEIKKKLSNASKPSKKKNSS